MTTCFPFKGRIECKAVVEIHIEAVPIESTAGRQAENEIITRFVSLGIFPLTSLWVCVYISSLLGATPTAKRTDVRCHRINVLVGQLVLPSRHHCPFFSMPDGVDNLSIRQTSLCLRISKVRGLERGHAFAAH